MAFMYDDEDVWEKHYEDWKRIIENWKEPSPVGDVKPEQDEYRLSLIKNLIKSYEAYHK